MYDAVICWRHFDAEEKATHALSSGSHGVLKISSAWLYVVGQQQEMKEMATRAIVGQWREKYLRSVASRK